MMDIKAIRLENLRRLAQEHGSLQQLAKSAQMSYDNLWQIDAGILLPSGRTRGVGDDLARSLEAACGKPAGWMDHDQRLPFQSEMARRIAAIYDSLSTEEQERSRRVFEAATVRAVLDEEVERRMPVTQVPPSAAGAEKATKRRSRA